MIALGTTARKLVENSRKGGAVLACLIVGLLMASSPAMPSPTLLDPIPANPSAIRCQQLKAQYLEAYHQSYSEWDSCFDGVTDAWIHRNGSQEVGLCGGKLQMASRSCCAESIELERIRDLQYALRDACGRARIRDQDPTATSRWQAYNQLERDTRSVVDETSSVVTTLTDPVGALRRKLKERGGELVAPYATQRSEMSDAIEFGIARAKGATHITDRIQPPVVGSVQRASFDMLSTIIQDVSGKLETSLRAFDNTMSRESQALRNARGPRPATSLPSASPDVPNPRADCSVITDMAKSRELMMRDRNAWIALGRFCAR